MVIFNRISLLIIFLGAQLLVPQVVWSQEDHFQKEIPPGNVQRLEVARQLRKNGKIADAIKRLRSLIRDEPNYYRAHYNLALAYVFKKDYDEAIKSFKKALEIKQYSNITDATIYNSIGWFYFLKGNYGKSEEYFKIAMKKENLDLLTIESKQKLFNNIGVLYMNMGELELSKKYWNKSVDEYNSSQARKNLEMLKELKATQKTIREAKKDYYFPVVGSFRTIEEATHFAKRLLKERYKYKAEIYLAENDYYGVTLGGYLSYDDADDRVAYAKSKMKVKDAYVWKSQDWGENLLELEDLEKRGTAVVLAGLYEAIVIHGFRGILGREPDPQASQHYVNFLEDGGSILDFCRTLIASEEYKENRKKLKAHDLAKDYYRAILEREPDPALFEYTVKMIREGRGAEAAAEMLSSREFRRK